MQEQQGRSGQQLQWWQEEKPVRASKWYEEATQESVPTSSTEVVHTPPVAADLWEELEAEAQRRVVLESQAVVIEGDLAANSRKRMRSVNIMLAVLSVLYIGLALLMHRLFFLVFPVIFFLEAVVLNQMVRRLTAGPKPSFRFSPLGMSYTHPRYQMSTVHWDEIESVQPTSLLGVQYLKVRFKNPGPTTERAFSMNNPSLKRFNLWLLRRMPWEIVTTGFPMSAKELAEKIAQFRPDLVRENRKRRKP